MNKGGREGEMVAVVKRAERAEAALKTCTVERDKALADYQFMVERAADRHLDGYRELGARAAAAENKADALKKRLLEALAVMEKLEGVHKAALSALRDLYAASVEAYKAGRIPAEPFVRAGNVLAAARPGQHMDDGVLYCDAHGTYQCGACGFRPGGYVDTDDESRPGQDLVESVEPWRYIRTVGEMISALSLVPADTPLRTSVGDGYKAAPIGLRWRAMTTDQRADWFDAHVGPAEPVFQVLVAFETSRAQS